MKFLLLILCIFILVLILFLAKTLIGQELIKQSNTTLIAPNVSIHGNKVTGEMTLTYDKANILRDIDIKDNIVNTEGE